MNKTKILTALLFATIILFFLGLLLTLVWLVAFFKKVEQSLDNALIILFALVIPTAVISGVSLLFYFLVRKRINEIESISQKEIDENNEK